MSLFDRTFHPDEANQAFTTGRLLETGTYCYNPQDHHGPTLYYAAAALQKAAGHNATATLDPTLLRCTPLLFAILTLLFGFLSLRKILRHSNGHHPSSFILHPSSIIFPLLLGTSPIFVFFATDFIQEMLLACFTMMMLWAGANYIFHPTPSTPQPLNPSTPQTLKRPTWAHLFGIAAGLAFATKETALLTFAAAGVSGLLLHFTRHHTSNTQTLKHSNTQTLALSLAGFLLTSVLFYSSFASNWQGVCNAFIAAPLSYLHRAAGSAASQGAAAHVHPWWQYLAWLFTANGRFSMIPLLALFALTFRPRRFLHLYAVVLLLLYSFIPYKTPWCALQIVLPLALAPCVAFPPGGGLYSRVAAALLAASIGCNAVGLYALNRDPDAKDIPYNYASASPQVKELAALVISTLNPSTPQPLNPSHTQTIQHSNTPPPFAAIALPPENTWPLPFYLRPVGGQVGYWTQFGELEALAGLDRKPAVVIVPAEEGHRVQPLFPHLTHTKRFEMRPHVRVRVFW